MGRRPCASMLLCCGSNGSGQLGLGHLEDVSTLVEVEAVWPQQVTITQIRGGGNHTLLLLDSGVAYACGANPDGRCGFQAPTESSRFVVCPSKTQWTHVAASWEASYFVSNSLVYSCGNGARGELGQGEGVVKSVTLQPLNQFVPTGEHIVSISSCVSHTVAVLSNGDVYGWGDGRKGQLGTPLGVVWQPRKIPDFSFGVAAISCGREFTVAASTPEHGWITVLGSDKWKIKSDAASVGIGYKTLAANWGSIHLLAGTKLTSWGRSNHGQLDIADLEIDSFAAGSEHCVAQTTDSKIVAWGWGEHGNTGRTKLDTSTACNELLTVEQRQSGFLAAGCATTWVLY